jgi:hypothetical protein
VACTARDEWLLEARALARLLHMGPPVLPPAPSPPSDPGAGAGAEEGVPLVCGGKGRYTSAHRVLGHLAVGHTETDLGGMLRQRRAAAGLHKGEGTWAAVGDHVYGVVTDHTDPAASDERAV